ncbi:MAG: AMP-binding protein [Desulfurococcales archaeon]|nr:AMP-binding protein [Desulfurococcales archaeon]
MSNPFPPNPTSKTGFYPIEIYEEALNRYPSVSELVRKKAEENGDKTWLVFQDGDKYSYRDVDNLSNSLATAFHQDGVRETDKVAIFALNSPEWILSYFGLLKIGATPVTVNTAFIKDPLIYNLKKSDSKYLVVDSRLIKAYKDVEDKLDNISRLFIIGGNGIDPSLEPRKEYSFVNEMLNVNPDKSIQIQKYWKDPSAMILTSGTTGPSKVVVETNAQFIATALLMVDAGGINANTVNYVYLPLFHIMALDLSTLGTMLGNGKMILVERFSTKFWDDVKKYKVTYFHAVGPILEMLLKQPSTPAEKDHDKIIAHAYASKEIWNIAQERFNILITGGYGGTEAGIPIAPTYDLVISGKVPAGSCGLVAPFIEVKIMDELGRFLPPNKVGEIVIRPSLPWTTFLEYYNMQEATVKAFRGLWFHTGDAGYFDENGFLYFVDRLKDAIRRKGENISSYEVEQILLKNPRIQGTAVVPVKSEVGEDEVMAVIIPASNDVTPEEIVKYSMENMPYFWVPRYIRLLDALPRTPTGRIQKFVLRREGVTEDTYDMLEFIRKIRNNA